MIYGILDCTTCPACIILHSLLFIDFWLHTTYHPFTHYFQGALSLEHVLKSQAFLKDNLVTPMLECLILGMMHILGYAKWVSWGSD